MGLRVSGEGCSFGARAGTRDSPVSVRTAYAVVRRNLAGSAAGRQRRDRRHGVVTWSPSVRGRAARGRARRCAAGMADGGRRWNWTGSRVDDSRLWISRVALAALVCVSRPSCLSAVVVSSSSGGSQALSESAVVWWSFGMANGIPQRRRDGPIGDRPAVPASGRPVPPGGPCLRAAAFVGSLPGGGQGCASWVPRDSCSRFPGGWRCPVVLSPRSVCDAEPPADPLPQHR